MNAKHLKNAMSHKLVFLVATIAIAIVTAFSICATSQALAKTDGTATNGDVSIIITEPGFYPDSNLS